MQDVKECSILEGGDEELWLDLVSLFYRQASKSSSGTTLSRLGSTLPNKARDYFPVRFIFVDSSANCTGIFVLHQISTPGSRWC